MKHGYDEQTIDLGEVRMNYAVAGKADLPALLLIPGQTESWWGYEKAMKLLEEHFRVYAVDLRGQGRSTRTPGRYTLDNMGNDLVRFIALEIKRPVIVRRRHSSRSRVARITKQYLRPPLGTDLAKGCQARAPIPFGVCGFKMGAPPMKASTAASIGIAAPTATRA